MLMSESKLIHLFSSDITHCCSLWVEEAIGMVEINKEYGPRSNPLMCGKRIKISITMESLFSAWFLS